MKSSIVASRDCYSEKRRRMGDGDDLTSQAIAELIREIGGGDPRSSSGVQERKVNPLGKPNKRFLGRTIKTALRHNQRESERTQAECQRKLKDLDERHEKRKSNYYYNRDAGRHRNRSSSSSRIRNRSPSRKVKKRRSSSRRSGSSSSNRRSRSYSRSRHHSHKKRKHESKHKRRKKTKFRRRSRSSSSSSSPEELPVPTVTGISSSELFFHQSKQMALAVAMAYSHGANGAPQNGRNPNDRASSSLSDLDIARELMSDDEHGNPDSPLIESLSISSRYNRRELLTINVSSSSAESRGTESDPGDVAGNFIVLDDSTTELESGHNSDIEIIKECRLEQTNEEPEQRQHQAAACSAIDSVDLTED
ncbi:RNA-binding protein with serine-rich domain 1 [Drosophila guanche]|nr:RNA-binding protein with serine-rich domain 1 [Drosophila guanche]